MKNSKFFQYRHLEIKAKLPKGDWLWPVIWMLPQPQSANITTDKSTGTGKYGVWPASGEVDIVEARGNAAINGYAKR